MSLKLVVPTFNPGSIWYDCVNAIKSQTLQPDDVLVIDSGSTDSTVAIAVDAGFRVIAIDKDAFNHGGTRQRAIEEKIYDYVVFLTQDAVIVDTDALKNLLRYFNDKNVAAVCGRQLPRNQAGAMESHARLFNYPEKSFERSIHDVPKYGLRAAFLSNSFAAYRISALSAVGGFPDDVIFGEDMYVAAKLLLSGRKIAYAADACVYHSHDYSVMQEFKRYFDMGVFHFRQPWLREEFGKAESEGLKFVVSEIRYLMAHEFWLIPEALLRTILRYTGFRLGLVERHIPQKIKVRLSMSPWYFNK